MSQQSHILQAPRTTDQREINQWQIGVYQSLKNVIRGRTETLGSTPQELLSFPVVANKTYLGEVLIVARQKGGGGGSPNNAFGSVALVKIDTGGVDVTNIFEQADEAWADSYTVTGGRFFVNVAGLVDRIVSWFGLVRLQVVS